MTPHAAAPDSPLSPWPRRFVAGLRRRPRSALSAALALAALAAAAALLVPPARAWYHARAAERAAQRGDFEEARSHLAVCLAVWPDSGRTHLLAARAARRAGRLDEAEQHLNRAQALGGRTDETALERVLLRVERGDVAEVEGYLKSTIGPDHPDAPIVLEALARGYLLTDRLFDLLECTTLWLQVRPHETHALFWRGLARERLGDWGEAVADYRAAVEADPDNIAARLRLGELLLNRMHEPDESLGHFEAARARGPSDPEARLGLALCQRALGHADAARELLDGLLAERPDDARALAERGRLALDEGDAARAESCLRRAVELAPDDREALYSFLGALRQQDKADEANRLEPRLKQLDADLRRLQEIAQAVAREPQNLALRTEAGEICLRYGRKDEGRRWLAGALRLDPSYRPARAALRAADPEAEP